MSQAMRDAAAALSRSAARRAAQIDRRCRAARSLQRAGSRAERGPTRALRRIAERLQCTGQWLSCKLRELFQHHWDVALFDLAFGSVKAFVIYPGLYFAGLAWTIPFVEYVPLNTQLWTAGYLLVRRQLLSGLGRLRYGYGLNRLDALRDRLLGIRTRDARSIHRFVWGGRHWVLRVRRSRVRQWLDGRRGIAPQPGVVLQAELRALLSDREFRRRANPLRANAHLYERVLIHRLLESPADRAKLLAAAAPARSVAGLSAEERALAALLLESPAPILARVIEQGDTLVEALRARAGRIRPATALALRWIHRAQRRRIRRGLAALADAEYRLLADHLDGRSLRRSPQVAAIGARRAEVQHQLERAEGFAERAAAVRCEARARRLAQAAIAEGRRQGLGIRAAAALLALGAAGGSERATARSTFALIAESSGR